jgi:WD40 repeat protein
MLWLKVVGGWEIGKLGGVFMSSERTPSPQSREAGRDATSMKPPASSRSNVSARVGALLPLSFLAFSAILLAAGLLASWGCGPKSGEETGSDSAQTSDAPARPEVAAEQTPPEKPETEEPDRPAKPTSPAQTDPSELPTSSTEPTSPTPESRSSTELFSGRKAKPVNLPLNVSWTVVEGTRSGTVSLPGQTGHYHWSDDGQWLFVLRYDPAELLKIRVPDFQITARLDLRESGEQLSGTTNFACMHRCGTRLVLFGTKTTFLGPATIHMKVEPEFVMLVDPVTLNVVRVVPIPKSTAVAAAPDKSLLYLVSAGDDREVRVVGTEDGRVIASCRLAPPPPLTPSRFGERYPGRPGPPAADSSRLFLRGVMTPDGENLYFCSRTSTWRFETAGQDIGACEVVAGDHREDGLNLHTFRQPDQIGLTTKSGVAVVSAEDLNKQKLFIRTDGPVAFDPTSNHYWSPGSRETLAAFDPQGELATELTYGHPRAGSQILVSPEGGAAIVGANSRIYWVDLTALPSTHSNDWLTRLQPTSHKNDFAQKPFPWSRGLPFLWVFGLDRQGLPAIGLTWSSDGKYLFAQSDGGILRRFTAPEFREYRQLAFRDFTCKPRAGFGRPPSSPFYGMGMVPYGKGLAVGLDEPVKAVAVVDPETMTVTHVLDPGKFDVLLPSGDSQFLFAASRTGIGCLQHPEEQAFTIPDTYAGTVAGQGKYLFAGRKLTRYSIGPNGLVKDHQDKNYTSGCPFVSGDGSRVGHNTDGRYIIRDVETFEEDFSLSRYVTIDGFSMTQRWLLGIGRPRRSTTRALSIFDFEGNSKAYDDPRSETFDPIAIDPLGRGVAIGFRYNQPGIIWMAVE